MNKTTQNRAAKLSGQLESYSTSARSSATLATLKQRMGNWPMYAAAAGSAMAMATGASAEIVSYTGPAVTVTASSAKLQPIAGYPFNGSNSVKTVNLGIAPPLHLSIFRKQASTINRHYAVAGAYFGWPQLQRLSDGYGALKELGNGQFVSAGAGHFGTVQQFGTVKWRAKGSAAGYNSGAPFDNKLGEWVAGEPGFAGFKFTTGSGQTDYGYAELEFTQDANGLPSSLTLLGAAYDDTGAPIETAPEPGTAGLMLLAMGAAGVTVLRRRGKQTARS